MREILFRGQHRRYGEKVNMAGDKLPAIWVYGGVLQGKSGHSLIYGSTSHNGEFEGKYPVYTDTLGQFTGLTDKNGVKIFEGDVVLEKHTGYKAVVEWQSDTCRFLAIIANRRSERSPHFFYVDKGSDRGSQMSSNEIIGNIHDNPELLGGAE